MCSNNVINAPWDPLGSPGSSLLRSNGIICDSNESNRSRGREEGGKSCQQGSEPREIALKSPKSPRNSDSASFRSPDDNFQCGGHCHRFANSVITSTGDVLGAIIVGVRDDTAERVEQKSPACTLDRRGDEKDVGHRRH